MEPGCGMALRRIDCAAVANNITTLRQDLRFVMTQKHMNRTGLACFPQEHLCISVYICVHLCCCLLLHINRVGHDRSVSRKSKGIHRYTQIYTDKHKHRWPSGRIAWRGAHQGMAFDARLVASPQCHPDLA
jgi:hypothetical protein